jgi:hypothetical protein
MRVVLQKRAMKNSMASGAVAICKQHKTAQPDWHSCLSLLAPPASSAVCLSKMLASNQLLCAGFTGKQLAAAAVCAAAASAAGTHGDRNEQLVEVS